MMNHRVAQHAKGLRVWPEVRDETIHLADGTTATTPGRLRLNIRVAGRDLKHTFQLLPSLESDILIGTDLWHKLGITIPPPPAPRGQKTPRKQPAHLITAGMT